MVEDNESYKYLGREDEQLSGIIEGQGEAMINKPYTWKCNQKMCGTEPNLTPCIITIFTTSGGDKPDEPDRCPYYNSEVEFIEWKEMKCSN